MTIPQPSVKRSGRKPATKLEFCDPSASRSTSLPAESAHRNETTASIIDSSMCWPPASHGPGVQRGGDRLRGVERGDLVGRRLAQEHRACRRRDRIGSPRGRRRPGSRCRRRCGSRYGPVDAEPGERRVDDVGVDLADVVVAEARACPSRPGRKFWISTSVSATSRRTMSTPGRRRGYRPRSSASRGCTRDTGRSCR